MITFRLAQPSDGASLAEIYKYYVENTSITFEYVAPSDEEFSERIRQKSENYPFIVALDDEKPVGYAYASLYRERAAYSWDVELSVYVDNRYCGMGIGPRLYSALEKILKLQNVVNMYACITHPNPNSIAMHEKMGFKLIGKFHKSGFKHNSWHDVYWYEKHLNAFNTPMPVISFQSLDKEKIIQILNTL